MKSIFIGFYARKMYPQYNHLNVPTWIIGPASGEGPLLERLADVLKVWPMREPIQRLQPAQLNRLLDQFYAHYVRGEAEEVYPTIREVARTVPRDVGAFARDYASAFGSQRSEYRSVPCAAPIKRRLMPRSFGNHIGSDVTVALPLTN